MRKNVFVILTVAVAALFAGARDIEQISVVENESRMVTVPFAVKNYAPSNKDVVRIELLETTSLRITGVKRGRCDLDVMGDNGLSKKYEIMVVDDLALTLETLLKELEYIPLPEVKAEIVGHFIRLDGEVSSIQKWESLGKALRKYGNIVENYVKFYPGPEILLRLKDTLEQFGLAVQFKPFEEKLEKKWPINTVALNLNKKTHPAELFVHARLLDEGRRNSIISVLKDEPWLTGLEDEKKNNNFASESKTEYAVRIRSKLFVDKPTIRLSVAYMAIGEEDFRKFGDDNNEGFVLNGFFQTIQGLLHGQGNHGNVATLNLGLDGVVRLLAQNGINRVSSKAYTTFQNWDEKGAHFKSGGSVFVRVAGADAADLKEIPYGFDVTTKGGLVETNVVDMDMNISISAVQPYGQGDDIDKKEDSTQQKVHCALGCTTLLSGFGQLMDAQTLKGFPVLRNVPLLSWFVASNGKELSDRRLIIMVCPEVMDSSQPGTIDVENDITIPVQTEGAKPTEQRIEERTKKYHGFWSWLNWFCW
ncbi:MAG: hypothetical protein IJR99_12895 [Kiritimatiellae bacterium]|nr:hypothetical protein [Kiritimatiellia bacterium]